MSEILSSLWGAGLLALGYFGPNKMALDGIRDLDDTSLVHALTYSLADAGAEALLFAFLAGYLYSIMGVRAVTTFATYVKATKMAVPFASICAFVPVISNNFFVEHNGVDPSLRFAWLRGSGANATAFT
jgi:hypothetical protein